MDADGSWSTQGLLCGSRGGAPSAWPSPCCASPGGRAGAGPSASCVFVKPPQLFPGTHISLSAVVTSRSWDPLAVFETTSLSKKTRGLCQEHLFLVCVCVCACGRSISSWCVCVHVAGASLLGVCVCMCGRSISFWCVRVCVWQEHLFLVCARVCVAGASLSGVHVCVWQEHLFLVCVCVCACGRSISFWCACAHVVFVTCVSALTGSLAPFPVSPGEGNGNHSSVLAWRIPGTGEPGGLPSMGLHRVGHD